MAGAPHSREFASAVLVDTQGRLLLQQRDNKPGILHPGMIGLFGGHREGDETFLECVVREVHEEISYFVPPERFEPLFSYRGPHPDIGIRTVECFLAGDIPLDQVRVTEGALFVAERHELPRQKPQIVPAVWVALQTYLDRMGGA